MSEIIEKTVIVIGAGGSHPYGFPTGNDLISDILNRENGLLFVASEGARIGNKEIFRFNNNDDLLREMGVTAIQQNHSESYVRADESTLLKEFFSGLKFYRKSQIDYFLRNYTAYRTLGKNFIAREILSKEWEAQEKIMKNGFNEKERDWIGSLLARLLQKVKKPEDLSFIAQNLTIITFNYDLVFEYYLDQFCRGEDEWGKALEEFKRSLKIVHIYGKLGRFEWEKDDALKRIYEEEMVQSFVTRSDQDFGSFKQNGYNYSRISDLAKGIKVIGGDKHQDNNLKHIQVASSALSDAKKVFFFGFGFDENNLSHLGCDRQKYRGKRLFYTVYEEGESERIEMAIDANIKNLKHADELGMQKSLLSKKAKDYGIYKKTKEIESLLAQI